MNVIQILIFCDTINLNFVKITGEEMKRIVRVSFDILITSIVPIAQCFLIGILLDSSLINVFSLTYPLQYVTSLLKSVFATGANIFACKEKDENAVNYGIVLGVIVGAILFGSVICQIENYIRFMNMEARIYRVFGIYSVMQIYLQFVLQLVLTKFYYQEENKKANCIALQFNLINFGCVIGLAVLTKSQVITVTVSLLVLFIYTALILITSIGKFEFKFPFWKSIKYDSVEFFSAVMMMMIYLFGFKNVFSFGENYVLAMTFATLVTDMQWDIIHSIVVVQKVDIAKKTFHYQHHMKNAYKLDGMLIASIVIIAALLYGKYQPDLKLAMIFIGAEVWMLMMYPIYMTRTCYLQLEYSATKTTINKQIANVIRMLLSAILISPYCTVIGQLVSMFYQLIYTKILWICKETKLEKLQNCKAKIECH